MRIAACIIRAVAAKEMSARRGVGVRGCVAEVAILAFGAFRSQELHADGDFVRIMSVAAHGTARACTYDMCQRRMRLTGWRRAMYSCPRVVKIQPVIGRVGTMFDEVFALNIGFAWLEPVVRIA